ncbi:hypothetical protein CHARACLAT_018910, partial [Characodon lateralis]|nr:hypothetical protein [Characodon lateralis]
PARCCVQEAALCWRSAPCWPSLPSSCLVEAVRGGSAPWLDTCRWHRSKNPKRITARTAAA